MCHMGYIQQSLKPVLWIGSSLKDMQEMPEEVKKEFGHSLREIQKGRDPGNTKPLKYLGESGIIDLILQRVKQARKEYLAMGDGK